LRYRDYDALLEDLRDAKTEATAKRLGVDLHPEQITPPEPAPSPEKKSILPLVLAAFVVAALAGALAYFLWPKPQTPTPPPARDNSPAPKDAPVPKPEPPPPPPRPPERLQSVEFSYRAPAAKTATLAGTFNNWSPDATPMVKKASGDWVVTLQLKPDRYLYKFVIDGRWMEDPDNTEREDDGHGGFNSVYRLSN
jgi:hypothetical protein